MYGTNAESSSVPTVANVRACYAEGTVTNKSACSISATDGPIALKYWHAAWGPISYSLWTISHGWDISARAHVQRYPHTALLYHRKRLGRSRVQIWYVGWGSLTKCFPQVMGWVSLHNAHVQIRTLCHLRNGLAD